MAETALDKTNFATRAAYVREELERLSHAASDLQLRLSQLQADVSRWETEAKS